MLIEGLSCPGAVRAKAVTKQSILARPQTALGDYSDFLRLSPFQDTVCPEVVRHGGVIHVHGNRPSSLYMGLA